MQTIFLDQDDDIISLCDRLDWTAVQRVLFVLPRNGPVLKNGLDLVRLRRFADRKRIEVGLVTPETPLLRQARALGLPAFSTLEAAETGRRGWWRGRRRREWLGLPSVGGLQDVRPERARGSRLLTDVLRMPNLSWRQWIIRYAAILLFFIAAAILFTTVAFLLPRATITLEPETLPVTAVLPLLADPTLTEINLADNSIPARLLTARQTWEAEIQTTGKRLLPSTPATGQVTFTNLTEQAQEVPAGTVLQAGDLAFQTLAPAALVDVADSTAAVDVVALVPGPEGNVTENQITTIVDEALSDIVAVRNPTPLTGGAVQELSVVAEADRTRLRAQVLQFLQAVALSEMETQLLQPEFLARESLQVIEIRSQTYSHAVGDEADRLSLQMEAILQATAVNPLLAAGLMVEPLGTAVPDGYSLVPESVEVAANEVVAADKRGRVTISILASAVTAANMNPTAATAVITGQPPELAAAYLFEHLPLNDAPVIDIWPLWFRRIPYRASRVHVQVEGPSLP